MPEHERVTLREFILAQLEAADNRFLEYVKYTEQRMARTEGDLNRRLHEMNEFREEARRKEAHFVPRGTYEAEHVEIRRRLESVENTRNVREGQLALIGTLITLGLVLVMHFWK